MASAKSRRKKRGSLGLDNITLRDIMGPKLSWEESIHTMRDKTQGVDIALFGIILALIVTGLVMMYSASYAYAYYNEDGNSNYYIIRQLLFAVIGGVGMFVTSLLPLEWLKGKRYIFLAISYILLIVVLFLPRIEGVHRWINLGITTFQPSEITKFAVILFGAAWAEDHFSKMYKFKYGVLPYAIVVGTTAALLIAEPHLSCTILVLLICATMMWVGGTDWKWFAALGAIAVVGIYVIIFSGWIPYSSSRVEVWKDPFIDPLGKGWQNIQALYAISSGGFLGQGLGNSRQKYLYISEPQNDFVFAVVCEELGFVGAVLIIVLFCMFVWRGFTISIYNSNRFAKLLGIGITAQVGWQALLNVA
ncbi:MAG: FtsW/RodA/SpoVE family cell cycle protein, partial [Clostridia bacterium]|nr:FtsW/RodA/SpoVE family cell cycle protein [Clostridia bacterium]